MKKESALVKLLDAEWHRACALLMTQVSVEAGEFDEAMGCQLEYLYWRDEFDELYKENCDGYWALRFAVLGVEWQG